MPLNPRSCIARSNQKTKQNHRNTMEGKSIENQTQTLDHHQQPRTNSPPIIQEWESKARIWLSSLPDQPNITTSQLESWINSNQIPLPEELQSCPRPQLLDIILSLNKLNPQSDQGKDSAGHPARFQRTDQWIPVYAWLESLDRNEVVKSKDITDWLSENPSVKEKLYSRHSRYHLMHYVQKCHMKILKRQGKLQKASGTITGIKSEPQVVKPLSAKISTPFVGKALPAVPFPYSGPPTSNLVKNKDVSLAKRTDDFLRYQLFTELESQLSSMLSKQDKQTA